jgi:transposase
LQKLALEPLQEIRIKYRCKAIDQENEALEETKTSKEKYKPVLLTNDDTVKQLLARSRYFLYKTNQSGLKTKQNEP